MVELEGRRAGKERPMLDPLTVVVVSLVAISLIVAVIAIREVGPGKVTRRVRCPDLEKRARLEVLYTEPVWGTLQATDITRCSLFGPARVSCDKKCLNLLN
jgi:hypothetical protein